MAGNGFNDSEKTPPVSEENDPADHEPSHKPSEPSLDGKDDSINKDEFPSQQAHGDAEEALEPDAGSDEPTIPEIEAPVVSGQPEEDTTLTQPLKCGRLLTLQSLPLPILP